VRLTIHCYHDNPEKQIENVQRSGVSIVVVLLVFVEWPVAPCNDFVKLENHQTIKIKVDVFL
jgi:hypothetical protein